MLCMRVFVFVFIEHSLTHMCAIHTHTHTSERIRNHILAVLRRAQGDAIIPYILVHAALCVPTSSKLNKQHTHTHSHT